MKTKLLFIILAVAMFLPVLGTFSAHAETFTFEEIVAPQMSECFQMTVMRSGVYHSKYWLKTGKEFVETLKDFTLEPTDAVSSKPADYYTVFYGSHLANKHPEMNIDIYFDGIVVVGGKHRPKKDLSFYGFRPSRKPIKSGAFHFKKIRQIHV